jgi:phage-related protein
MAEKPLLWVGNAHAELRAFPDDARRRAGFELHQVQQGLSPSDWKPMSTVGSGVQELRIHMSGEHRVLYVAKFEEAVYVLHAFEKKSQKTPQRTIEIARDRLATLVAERKKAKAEAEP